MVDLSFEDKIKLIDETNIMIDELNILKIDLMTLKDQISRISKLHKIINPNYNDIYEMLSNAINTKNKRVLFLIENIKKNESILGIKKQDKKKRKNKTL